ncbi:MAG: hypothetical protein KC621_32120 [Myxococcales bacterium]|nr:hypothetical protein [Myxococcales bacterium]
MPMSTEPLTQAVLHRRRQEVAERHQRALGKVNEMVATQKRLGGELSDGMASLSRTRAELEATEQAATGLLATLTRPFTARRTALMRRSVAEELFKRYEATSVRLREATAFTDELKLVALELQHEVDRLHRELGEATRHRRTCAERVLRAEHALAELDGEALTPEERERRRDRYTFDLRTEAVDGALYETAVELCRHHLDPARALRDTVLKLHEEMASYVLSATHTVNAAGRRIQGLGMLADAPLVVAELQASLGELDEAMQATARYVEEGQRMVAEVLPELSARLRTELEVTEQALCVELDGIDREKARLDAERALRRAADAEIADLLKGE